MKSVLIDEDTRILYWKEKRDRDLQEQVQVKKEEQAFNQGLEQGIKEGKWKGEVKGEIGKIKIGLEAKWDDEKILKKLKHTCDKFEDFKKYFEENPNQLDIDDNESVIMGELGLSNNTDIEYGDNFS